MMATPNQRIVAPDGTLYAVLTFHDGFMIGDRTLSPENHEGTVSSITWTEHDGTQIVVREITKVGSTNIHHYRSSELVNLTTENRG